MAPFLSTQNGAAIKGISVKKISENTSGHRTDGQTEHLVPQEDAEGADLRHALQDAIKREDYEEAARLHDRLEKLDSPLENPGIMD